jgi:predicted permease
MIADRVRSALHRVTTLFRRPRREAELDDELRFHLEAAIEEHVARGMDPAAARTAALRQFGGVEQVKEACRDERGLPWLETSARDVRGALRGFARRPAFAGTAILVLALGIGATTAIFSAVHGVLMAPLPYPEPDRLVALWEHNEERGWGRANGSPANILDWQERARTLERVSGHGWVHGRTLAVGEDGPARGGARLERVDGVEVIDGFFDVLGVGMQLGPGFSDGAHWRGEERAVVIGDSLWRGLFGADPGAVGRSITLDGATHTVVGVAPAGFSHPEQGLDYWVPFDWQPGFLQATWFRQAHFVRPIARLAPGVTVEQASAELDAVAARLGREHPDTNRGYGAGATALHEWMVGDVRRPLLVLFVAVVLVLLLTCANTANLLLARAGERQREMAMRRALGASRGRLVRQLLVESLTLSALGGLAGLVLAALGTRALATLAADSLPRAHEIAVDLPVLGAALAATVATGFLFGLLPALRLARRPAGEAMAESSDRVAGGPSRLLGGLVVAEVALAAVLVLGAGLTLESFTTLVRVDPGFNAADRATATFFLPPARYEAERVHPVVGEIVERARRLPGVRSATLASSLPLEGPQWTADFLVEGRPDEPGIDFARRLVTPGYFRTMGVPVVEGRGFSAADDARGRPVAIVNRTLAGLHFGEESPVGKRIAIGREVTDEMVWREIVGVVADEKIESLAAPWRMEIFVPVGQDDLEVGLPQRQYRVVVRSEGGAEAALGALAALRAEVLEIDPELLLFDVETLDEIVAGASFRERFLVLLLTLFAGLALALATVGVYGLMAYAVASRRREIGIRLALGASGRGVVGEILGRGMALFGAGLVLGLAAVRLLGPAFEAVLFEVRPDDPANLATGATVLAVAAFLAAWLPARRASRVDPLETLRVE